MALTSAKWCDFVVYTRRGLRTERIEFDKENEKVTRKIALDLFSLFFTTSSKMEIWRMIIHCNIYIYSRGQKYESIFLVLSSGGCSSSQGLARCLRLDAWALLHV